MPVWALYVSYNNFYGDIKIPHTLSAYTICTAAHDTGMPNLKFTYNVQHIFYLRCATREVPSPEYSTHTSHTIHNLNISLESVWRRTPEKSFSIFFSFLFLILFIQPNTKLFLSPLFSYFATSMSDYRMTHGPSYWYSFSRANGIWSCRNFSLRCKVAKRILSFSQSWRRWVLF